MLGSRKARTASDTCKYYKKRAAERQPFWVKHHALEIARLREEPVDEILDVCPVGAQYATGASTGGI